MKKKGLSSIITTLMIILLVLVSTGLIWVVVNDVLRGAVDQVNVEKIAVSFQIKNVVSAGDSVNLTIKREPGLGDFVGMKFAFKNETASEIIERSVTMVELEEKSFSFVLSNVSDVTTVSVYSLILSNSGEEELIGIGSDYNVRTEGSGGGSPTCTDGDGDGYGNPGDASCPNGATIDCNDTNSSINPGAAEICDDGVDNDCDGDVDCADASCSSYISCNNVTFLTNNYSDSLVSWWRMNGDANDSVGVNHGTENGGVDCNAGGVYGNACDFDGISNNITIPDSNSLDIIEGVTIIAWINPNSIKSGFSAFVHKYIFNQNGYGLGFENSGNCDSNAHLNMFYGDLTSYWNFPCPSVIPSLNSWQFVAGLYQNGTDIYKYYKNDTEIIFIQGGGIPPNAANSLDLIIGKDFNGTLDEVMIFNRSLTASEISTIYGLNLSH